MKLCMSPSVTKQITVATSPPRSSRHQLTLGTPSSRLFHVAWLVELNLHAARHREMRDRAVTGVGDLVVELHAARLELFDRPAQVIGEERDVVRAGRRVFALRRMHAEVSLRKIEDQPAAADVRTRQLELVAQERPQLRRLR